MRNIKWTNNSKIENFWSQILVFQIEIFLKFVNFPIGEIPKISKLENLKNFNLEKYKTFYSKIRKIWNLENFQQN